jgi:hypothetical protein
MIQEGSPATGLTGGAKRANCYVISAGRGIDDSPMALFKKHRATLDSSQG